MKNTEKYSHVYEVNGQIYKSLKTIALDNNIKPSTLYSYLDRWHHNLRVGQIVEQYGVSIKVLA